MFGLWLYVLFKFILSHTAGVFHDDGDISSYTSALALHDLTSVFQKFKSISRIQKVHVLSQSGNIHNLIYVYIYIMLYVFVFMCDCACVWSTRWGAMA